MSASGLKFVATVDRQEGSVKLTDVTSGASRVYVGLTGCAEALAIRLQIESDAIAASKDIIREITDLRGRIDPEEIGLAIDTLTRIIASIERDIVGRLA